MVEVPNLIVLHKDYSGSGQKPNEHFFKIFESSLEVQRVKRKFSDSPGHNILELYNVLVQVRFATSKPKIDT